LSVAWDPVPDATDYWTRAEYADGSGVIAEAWHDGGWPSTSITFGVAVGEQGHFLVHAYNANYPAADPVWPMGVGFLAGISITCTAAIVSPQRGRRLRPR